MEESKVLSTQEKNKEAVKRLYSEVILKGDRLAAEELLLEDYVQHNPLAANGREGLLDHVADLQTQYPNREVKFIHLFADKDYVITHIHFIMVPGEKGSMGMDIFRFRGEKIAEHWDVIQAIPDESANVNGMA